MATNQNTYTKTPITKDQDINKLVEAYNLRQQWHQMFNSNQNEVNEKTISRS